MPNSAPYLLLSSNLVHVSVGFHARYRAATRLRFPLAEAQHRVRAALREAVWQTDAPRKCPSSGSNVPCVYGIARTNRMVLVVYPNVNRPDKPPVLATVYGWDPETGYAYL